VCDFSVDPVESRTAKIGVDANKVVMTLTNLSPPPTATYNNIRYACNKIELYRNAQHTYDGNTVNEHELVAYFTSPGYKAVLMSVPVNGSGASGTPSTKFFNAFVGNTDSQTQISLGPSWTVQNVVPENMSYFVYSGRSFTCETECIWIVYNSPVFMNTTDSSAVKNVLINWIKQPQQLSTPGSPDERKVYFRDAIEENPAYMKKDGKVYMKCRRLNTKGQVAGEEGFDNMREGFFGGEIEGLENPPPPPEPAPVVRSGGAKATEKKGRDANTALQAKNVLAYMYRFYLQIGGFWGILLIVFGTAFTILLQTLWSDTMNQMFDWMVTLPNFVHEFLFR
jgi:hypothetical protein